MVIIQETTNGIHWTIKELIGESEQAKLTTTSCGNDKKGGIVHPTIHRFPWKVTNKVGNKWVVKALKKQPFRRYKSTVKVISKLIDKLQQRAGESQWHTAAMA
ncbi:hypothetical protein PHMEG_00013054 [Phytophthora megakarya]|uniref:Uncharacterized protein n=1 Tax=Phytophthora megakarya TaxID=4795 RepID=A0A225W793_9STRA|nr:hypothetical protein PHMEG_00013054 [Phytophthora megakarya]